MIAVPRVFIGGLVAIALSAAACSGGGGADTASSTAGNVTAAPSPAVTAAAASNSCPANSGLSGNVNDHGAAAAGAATIQVEASDFFFSPTCETNVPRGTVSLVVKNTGQALHNISITAQNIDVDVAPGQTITVQVKIGKAAVSYVCKYHRTSGMVGSLIPAGS